jgi:hypothetical protein
MAGWVPSFSSFFFGIERKRERERERRKEIDEEDDNDADEGINMRLLGVSRG